MALLAPSPSRYSFTNTASGSAVRPSGPRTRTTSRGMNDAVLRASAPPPQRPRGEAAGPDGHMSLAHMLAANSAEFSKGVMEGLFDAIKSTAKLVAHDLWQLDTYAELATTLRALSMLAWDKISTSLASAEAYDARHGTHVAQRQAEILDAINKLLLDAPRWTPRQWGYAVGMVVGNVLLAKGAGGALKVAGRVGGTAAQVARANVASWELGTMSTTQAVKTVAQKLPSILTDSEGFLIGPIATVKAPVAIPASFYTSEASFRFGSFRYATIAPKFMFNSRYFGRRMLQITETFQPKLGPVSRSPIPKGTPFKMGLVGPQPSNGVGLPWFQFFVENGVPFK